MAMSVPVFGRELPLPGQQPPSPLGAEYAKSLSDNAGNIQRSHPAAEVSQTSAPESLAALTLAPV